jgi:DNA-binding NarL/FixJ family response regulator
MSLSPDHRTTEKARRYDVIGAPVVVMNAPIPLDTVRSPQANASHEGRKRVLLIDNVRLRRECLIEVLQDCCPDLDFMAADFAQVLLACQNGEPDLVVFNAHRTGISDLPPPAVEAIYARSIPLMAIVDRSDLSQSMDALNDGLAGIFSREDNVELLVAAVRLVLAGGRFLPPQRRGR